jgi:hypothetical protein
VFTGGDEGCERFGKIKRVDLIERELVVDERAE